MSRPRAPRIEPRSAGAIADEVAARARIRMDGSDPMGEGLVRVFARYFGIVAERLNRVPEKHHQAFLGQLGTQPVLPTAARVPLTFVPIKQLAQRAAGADADRAWVPMRTRVAADPADGGEPVVFETERPLELTAAVIDRMVVLDAVPDRVAEISDLAGEAAAPVRLFVDRMRRARHDLYIERPEEWPPETSGITVHFAFGSSAAGGRSLSWELVADVDRRPVVPDLDPTAGLTTSGKLRFSGLVDWPVCIVAGHPARWLRCKPAAGEEPRPATIDRIEMSGRFFVEHEAPASASFNAQPIDLSTGFFPLGQAPKFGDAFYLRSRLFAIGDADVAVRIDIANPLQENAGDSGLPLHTHLVWECANEARWVPLPCEDTTHGLTRSGVLSFRSAANASVIALNGVTGGWIRARLAKAAATPHASGAPDDVIVVDPVRAVPAPAPVGRMAPFAPAIERIVIDAAKAFPRQPLAAVVMVDDFETAVRPVSPATPVDPFMRRFHDRTGLYLRLTGGIEALLGRTLSLYATVDESAAAAMRTPLSAGETWNGLAWSTTGLVDETGGLTRPGGIFLDMPRRPEGMPIPPAPAACWIRMRWAGDGAGRDSVVERIALNTVTAIAAVTYEDELLGSSTGLAHQTFHCARVPVIGDLRLEVREPDRLGDRAGASAVPGSDHRVFTIGHGEGLADTWVRWTAVRDFFLSGPADRHVAVDPLSGRIEFGDGTRGMIPPASANNVRLRRYRVGGGARGNVPAGSVTALRTTIRYVTGVFNPVAASGGEDVEPMDRCMERGSAWLRHRDRAVTREDFEDLALALPQIARARCLPVRAIDRDPDAARVEAGSLSVLVVPRTGDPRPIPTATQLRIVQDHLDARKTPAARLVVVGVSFVAVDVDVELVCGPDEDPGTIAARCRARLDDYLHPLHGGPAGRGWPFGDRPTAVALDAMLRRIDGVERLDALMVRFREDRPGLSKTEHFLICTGTHRVGCTLRRPIEAGAT
ncbi:MAG: putative baseplate assembly protein [Burkholderiaceae bacterium]